MRLIVVLVTLAVLSGCVTSGQLKERGERPTGVDRKGAN
jgi:hypothetical protein